MIAPVTPFTIRGALWYQGEANAAGPAAFSYRRMLPALIRDWRRSWTSRRSVLLRPTAEFPRPSTDPNQSGDWAVLRESQADALAVTNTGMAVTIDVGDAVDIHPATNGTWADVSPRRAGKNLRPEGARPEPDLRPDDGRWPEGPDPLPTRGRGAGRPDGGPVKGFVVAGADGKFAWADAVIDGSAVVVSSASVPQPTTVRYAWGDNPVGNLYNQAGLPGGALPDRSANSVNPMSTIRQLVVPEPLKIAYEDIKLPPLGPGQVRARTVLSGISHGTEMAAFLGTSPFRTKKFTAERVFVPIGPSDPPFYPYRYMATTPSAWSRASARALRRTGRRPGLVRDLPPDRVYVRSPGAQCVPPQRPGRQRAGHPVESRGGGPDRHQ